MPSTRSRRPRGLPMESALRRPGDGCRSCVPGGSSPPGPTPPSMRSHIRRLDEPEQRTYSIATHPPTHPIFRINPAFSARRTWWAARDMSFVPMCLQKSARCNG